MARNLVIGGGIAGLCVAFHLHKCKEDVTVIESRTVGSQASSKAAGMITPASETHLGENTLMETFLKACSYYSDFVDSLTSNNPKAVDFCRQGSLMCAIDADGHAELSRLHHFQKSMGLDIEELTQTQTQSLEPNLTHKTVYALLAKNEAHIDTRKLLITLKEFLCSQGVAFKEGINSTEQDKENADRVFICTGLENPCPILSDITFPQRGVKGQVLTLQTQAGTITRPIRIYHRYPIYLVPRADGRVVVGATSEELSDQNVTAGGVLDLIYAAWQALPLIYDSPIVETSCGLRPATLDHKPIVGSTALKNVYVLTALYRHGIMAAPYLAKELCDLALEKPTELNWEEFSYKRFREAA